MATFSIQDFESLIDERFSSVSVQQVQWPVSPTTSFPSRDGKDRREACMNDADHGLTPTCCFGSLGGRRRSLSFANVSKPLGWFSFRKRRSSGSDKPVYRQRSRSSGPVTPDRTSSKPLSGSRVSPTQSGQESWSLGLGFYPSPSDSNDPSHTSGSRSRSGSCSSSSLSNISAETLRGSVTARSSASVATVVPMTAEQERYVCMLAYSKCGEEKRPLNQKLRILQMLYSYLRSSTTSNSQAESEPSLSTKMVHKVSYQEDLARGPMGRAETLAA